MDYDLWRRFARPPSVWSPCRQPLAAFRKLAEAEDCTLAPYYAEIGVHLPHAFRAVTLPIRALLIPLTERSQAAVSYNRAQLRWVLHAVSRSNPAFAGPIELRA